MNVRPAELVSAVLFLMGAVGPAVGQDLFDDCDAQLAAEPYSKAAARCYHAVAESQEDYDEAARRLQARVRRHPDAPWLHFYRGNVLWQLSTCGGEPEASYRQAVQLFAKREELDNEVRARTSLAWLLARCDLADQALAELVKAERPAEQTMDPLTLPRLVLVRARLPTPSGRDLDATYLLLKENWQSISQPDLDELEAIGYLRREYLRALAMVCLDLGLSHEYRDWREKQRLLAQQIGSARDVVAVAYGELLYQLTELPDEYHRQEMEKKWWALLRDAQEAKNRGIEARVWWHLARMTRGHEAEGCLERCEQAAAISGEPDLHRKCALARAVHLLENEPNPLPQELSKLSDTRFFAPDSRIEWDDGWDDYFRVLWRTRPRDEALAGVEQSLSIIESYRTEQGDLARVQILDVWSSAYYWLSGRLLADAASDDDLRRAFAVMERLRSQVLREILFRAAATPLPPPPTDLMDQVAVALADDEAMISFQLSFWQDTNRRFAGGAWAVVTTRERSWAKALEIDGRPVDRVEIERLVEQVEAGGSDSLNSVVRMKRLFKLHEALLSSVLDELPGDIRRLTLVPDGILHLLPFAALRPAEGAPTLGEQFEIEVEPSAALWLSWKRGIVVDKQPALVFAAPELSPVADRQDEASVTARSEALAPLPYASREGKKVLRHLGGGGLLLQGAEASEQFIKQADLRSYGLLHFATHAVANSVRPWRSCVFLASGDGTEDGCFGPDEITELDLSSKIIVLSTCDSATGGWYRGEGVMSLARAFFKAGAHAVVGTLKPLPDDQGARFFDDFYRYLSRGHSLRQALGATQRQWIEEGRPASTWATVVVLGNGDLAPAPGGVERSPSPWLLGSAFAALVLLVLGVWRRLWRNRQAP